MPFIGTDSPEKGNSIEDGSSHTQRPLMPIAIVGMSCRLPGDVSTPNDFWMMCARARSAWSEIPKSRFAQDAYYHPSPGKTGTHNAKGGHFLTEDVGLFDAPFFNITAAEARALDPQQRLMLETTFDALESAGIPKSEVVGQNVGVFVGAYGRDYEQLNARDIETAPMYLSTGCSSAIVSNRISYYFDMRGPSFTVDTACSSSLTALHVACQSLRNGECPIAVVGGVHLNLGPDTFVTMSLQRLFADSGKSYAFDHRGVGGFGRGEGAGCIILKPLDEAIKSKDVIRAVITNTGINQDGRTNGITMPNGASQEELMRSVYAKAGISVEDVGFVEAHGTGTKVGDPIEARALHSVFAANRTPKKPLYVGSVKSNIGHSEAASGVVSVIKAAMMLERGFILPNANWEKFPDSIPTDLNLKVPVTQRPWPKDKKYISINNFGYGGANAHIILEKAPRSDKAVTREVVPSNQIDEPPRRLFVISANDEKSLQARIKDLIVYVEQRPETFEKFLTRNLAYTLGERRSILPWKVALTAVHYKDITPQLSAANLRPVRSIEEPKIGFAFTGQGAQWHAMGRELMIYPVFASSMKMANVVLIGMGASFSIIEELSKDAQSSSVNEAHVSQPICTAVQIALTELLRSWNVYPTAVTGHSSGEIAAAYAAGALTFQAAMAIAYYRGIATIDLKAKFPNLKGGMMAVGAGPTEIQPLLDSLTQGRVVVACINSPSSITASGDEAGISELQKLVEEEKIFNRKLKVDVAYHSHHMQKIAEDYYAAIKDVVPCETTVIKFHSSLLGREIDTRELGPTYWVQNLTSPVRFSESVADMCVSPTDDGSSNQKINMVVEVGPHAALEGPIKQILKANGISTTKLPYASMLVRNKDAVETAQTLAANLFMRGCPLKMSAINLIAPGSRDPNLLTDLPRYPFNHETRYWHTSRIAEQHCFKKSVRNDIIGIQADYSNALCPEWRNIIRADDIPWVRHHKMQSMTVYPMSGYVAMALEAASQRAASRGVEHIGNFNIRELVISRPLVISDDAEIETTITLRPYKEGTRNSSDIWDEFTVSSWSSDRGWIQHCHGLVSVRENKNPNVVSGQYDQQDAKKHLSGVLGLIRERCDTKVDIKRMYEELSAAGATYGETFQGLENATSSDGFSMGDIVVSNTAAIMPQEYERNYLIHPAFLDIFLHTMWPLFGAGRTGFKTLYMPSSVKNITIRNGILKDIGSRLRTYATGLPNEASPKPTSISLYATVLDSTEEALILFEDMTMSPVLEGGDAAGTELYRQICYGIEWVPALSDTETGADDKVNDVNETTEVAPATNGNGNGIQPQLPEASFPQVTIIFREQDQSALALQLAHEVKNVTGQETQLKTLTDSTISGGVCIMLAELDKPFLADMSPELFNTIHRLVTSVEGLIWVVRGASGKVAAPNSSVVTGLARSIRSETNIKFATIDLDSEKRPDDGVVRRISTVFKAIFASGSTANDFEYRECDGQLFVPRVDGDSDMDRFIHRETSGKATLDPQPFSQSSRPLKIKVGTPGALDTLHFIDDAAVGTELAPEQVEIEVKATSMNFKDIMISMGQLSSEYLGIECSGVISRIGTDVVGLAVGDRVCASTEGAYSTFTRCNYTSASRIPDQMTFEEAATIPIVFCTAYYSLFDLGRLTHGETVLIHAAAGGVGQAAIMLAKHAGAEIYATVSSEDKKKLIMERYGVLEDHIFYSRDTSFGPAIRRATEGRGVDVILNSLAGDLLRETWDCISHFGRFVEIGKRDIVGNTRLEMRQFDYNASFSSVDLTVVAAEKPKLMKRLLDDVFKLLRRGTVKPITPINVYAMSEVETAFRLLQSGKAMGKLVIVPGKDDQVKATTLKIRDNLLRYDATYVIIGGTGGLGRSISRWMISKGARHIVLLSRSGSSSGKVHELIEEANAAGATIVVRACDIANRTQVDAVLNSLSDLPPVRGLIHGAMVLKDTLFENMDYSGWHDVVTPKVAGAWNFHNALQTLSIQVDFFIMLSSTAGIIGNRGQAAYAAANTFLDSFAAFRRSNGLPATSIDLTAVSDVGVLSEDSERAAATAQNFGNETLVEKEVLALVAAAISGKTTLMAADQIITGLYVSPETVAANFWIQDGKFMKLRKAAEAELAAAGPGTGPTVSLETAVKRAKDESEAENIIYDALAAKLSAVLMVPLEEMSPGSSIASYGLDSLVAIEIRNWISRELGANFQVLELLTSPTMKALVKSILGKRNKA